MFESNDNRDDEDASPRLRNARDEQPVVFEPPSGNPEVQQELAQSTASNAGDNTLGNGPSNAIAANLAVKIVADEATNSLLIRSTARDYRQRLSPTTRRVIAAA